MRKLLFISFLMLILSNPSAFANRPLSTDPLLDNDSNTSETGPIGGIINGIKKLDAWIQENLW